MRRLGGRYRRRRSREGLNTARRLDNGAPDIILPLVNGNDVPGVHPAAAGDLTIALGLRQGARNLEGHREHRRATAYNDYHAFASHGRRGDSERMPGGIGSNPESGATIVGTLL